MAYRQFLLSVLIYFATDIMWGFYRFFNQPKALFCGYFVVFRGNGVGRAVLGKIHSYLSERKKGGFNICCLISAGFLQLRLR